MSTPPIFITSVQAKVVLSLNPMDAKSCVTRASVFIRRHRADTQERAGETGKVAHQLLHRCALVDTRLYELCHPFKVIFDHLAVIFDCLHGVIACMQIACMQICHKNILVLLYSLLQMLAGQSWIPEKCISSYHCQIWTKYEILINKNALRTIYFFATWCPALSMCGLVHKRKQKKFYCCLATEVRVKRQLKGKVLWHPLFTL